MKFKNYIYFEERDDLRTGETNLKATDEGKVKKETFVGLHRSLSLSLSSRIDLLLQEWRQSRSRIHQYLPRQLLRSCIAVLWCYSKDRAEREDLCTIEIFSLGLSQLWSKLCSPTYRQSSSMETGLTTDLCQ